MIWQTARGTLDLGTRAVVMGVVNVTPDSFSDGGAYPDAEHAIEHALSMLAQGAAIIDVGGESTRPGALPVDADEECRRVLPVVKGLLARAPHCLISVDTSKATVAREALGLGAAIVNDVTALRGDEEMAAVVAAAGAGVVLMHMQGEPRTMQAHPAYEDVAAEVRGFLQERLEAAINGGIARECVALDPGIGFGKALEHNLELLRSLETLAPAGRPLVLGVSRKSFLARISGAEIVAERLGPTVALTAMGRERGARVLRVHDVQPNVAALRACEAVLNGV